MIKIGNADIVNIYVGDSAATAVYLGNDLVWSTGGHSYLNDYFTLKALESGHFGWNIEGVLYSLNGGVWTAWDYTNGIDVNADDEVRFKDNAGITRYANKTISATGNFDVMGNSMSLFYADNFTEKTTFPSTNGGEFQGLFSGNTKLVSAENLILPATSLNSSCYSSMFRGCTSLTTAPELPATTLTDFCYSSMFRGCTSLNYIKCLATDISANSCTFYWTYGFLTTTPGTFVKDATMTGWPTGNNGIPSGWNVISI